MVFPDDYYHMGDTLPAGISATIGAGEVLLVATWDVDSSTYFTLQLHASGTYTFDLITPPGGTPINADLTSVDAGKFDYLYYDAETSDWGSQRANMQAVDETNAEVKITGSADINASGSGIGVDNQHYNSGEVITFELLDGLAKSMDIDTQRAVGDPELVVKWEAFDGANLVDSGYVLLNAASQSLTFDPDGDVGFDKLVFTGMTAADGPFAVDNAAGTYTSDDGANFTFTGISIDYGVVYADQNLSFNVAVIDGDGDVSTSDVLTVHIEGDQQTDSGGFLLTGTMDSDSILGSDGADIFAISANGDQGSDTLSSFSIAEGDTLHIYDVLDGDPLNVDVNINVIGGDVQLTINNATQVTIDGLGGQLGWVDGSSHTFGELDAAINLDVTQDPPTI